MRSLFNLAYILNLLKSIKGRTRIQKIIYILKYKGYPFHEDFSYSYFGPYSDDLRNEIDFLVSVGVLNEKKVNGSTYIYKPTEKMKVFLRITKDLVEKDLKQSNEISSLLKKLNKLSIPVLEVFGTILFLKKEGFKGREIKSALKELKPEREKYFEHAFSLTKTLDL